ncbi:hypothetical protein [Methylophaga thiooxydans]|uniref:Uncharacterized protein n=1 Tax=Methylophaga thiooxydans DMS010 TaxID=637616 RepID=C0N5X2_9GAMM|nr:hypothetical protein [Methylophaga thiooxydans]EEF79829.1 hypothetical protein MDMS009_1380 [Methylophaga thiooxydans DMS010]
MRTKKFVLSTLVIVVLLLASTMLHNVYAGKPFISLNAPVSFPVDI